MYRVTDWQAKSTLGLKTLGGKLLHFPLTNVHTASAHCGTHSSNLLKLHALWTAAGRAAAQAPIARSEAEAKNVETKANYAISKTAPIEECLGLRRSRPQALE